MTASRVPLTILNSLDQSMYSNRRHSDNVGAAAWFSYHFLFCLVFRCLQTGDLQGLVGLAIAYFDVSVQIPNFDAVGSSNMGWPH